MMPVVDVLLRDPILVKCKHAALARLLPFIEERSYAAGEHIYKVGDDADGLYLLTAGEASLQTPDGETHRFVAGAEGMRLGEECATDAAHFLAEAIALTTLKVMFIPRPSLQPLLADHPALKAEFMFALMGHMTGNRLKAIAPVLVKKAVKVSILPLVGWITAIVLPVIVLLTGNKYGLDHDTSMFLAIFSATVTMWIFPIVDDYVASLFAMMAILISGLVPVPVALSGFASDGFLMAMSILGLSTVIISSGLGYRAMLLLLRHLPNTRFWHNFGLAMTGFFITPLIPSTNGRISLVMPFYVDMMQSLRFAHKKKAATQLMVSTFTGASLLSAMFLSSKTVNFAVLGLLPMQTQDNFQGFKWLMASGVAAIVLLIAYSASTSWLFRSEEKPRLSKERVASQLHLLGAMKQREWAALLGITVFIVGLTTASLHRISPPWLGLSILYGLLLWGSLSKKELKEKVDWTFLIYLSGLTGMISTFSYLGLNHLLAEALPGLGSYMRDSFGFFVLILFGVICLIRLLVPSNATIVIMASIFIPLAGDYGINPWVIGFVILMLGEIWFFPYQCTYYLQVQSVNRLNPLFSEKTFLLNNAFMNLARLAAVYASLPYWKAIGLL